MKNSLIVYCNYKLVPVQRKAVSNGKLVADSAIPSKHNITCYFFFPVYHFRFNK